MSEPINSRTELKKARQKVALPLLGIAMVSIVMLFAGLTSAYIVTQADNFWVSFDLPVIYSSTVLPVNASISFASVTSFLISVVIFSLP